MVVTAIMAIAVVILVIVIIGVMETIQVAACIIEKQIERLGGYLAASTLHCMD